MAPRQVILYTRRECHLCHEAQSLLESYGLTVETVDIDGDSQLKDRYDLCVPVVIIDGRERFRGRIDEVLLRRLLHSSADGDAGMP